MVRFRTCQRDSLTFYEICRAMSVPRVIMGIMYADVDSLCCRLSSRANKSGGSVTEQAANTERIKAGADVGSRGHQHAGAGLQNSSADTDCEDNFPSSRVVTAEEGGGGKKTRRYLRRHAGPARLPSGGTREIVDGEEKWPPKAAPRGSRWMLMERREGSR